LVGENARVARIQDLREQADDADADVEDEEVDAAELAAALDPQLQARARRRQDVNTQGGEYYNVGMFDEAVAAFEQLRDLVAADLGAHHPQMAAVLNNLAMARANQNAGPSALQTAAKELEAAVELREVLNEAEPWRLVAPLMNLALVRKRAGLLDEAGTALEQAIDILERFASERSLYAVALNNLATLRHMQNRRADARVVLQRALALLEQRKQADTAGSSAHVTSRVAAALDFQENEPLEEEDADDEEYVELLATTLGNAILLAGADRSTTLKQAVRLEKLLSPDKTDHPQLWLALKTQARLAASPTQAITPLERLESALQAHFPASHPRLRAVQRWLTLLRERATGEAR
jgi:tetratricopeptide (TPR) repeat protein